jgi:hypothetical protein
MQKPIKKKTSNLSKTTKICEFGFSLVRPVNTDADLIPRKHLLDLQIRPKQLESIPTKVHPDPTRLKAKTQRCCEQYGRDGDEYASNLAKELFCVWAGP